MLRNGNAVPLPFATQRAQGCALFVVQGDGDHAGNGRKRLMDLNEEQEVLLSQQPAHLWRRRKLELMQWTEREKQTVAAKRTEIWNDVEVDAELVDALTLLHRAGVRTEFSCAGVSPLDEPVDHSLYAYVTLVQNEAADRFVTYALSQMRNRLLATLETGTGRYDLSSFFIGHNRSFCWWMQYCAAHFMDRNDYSVTT
jgi:hypothetical protein